MHSSGADSQIITNKTTKKREKQTRWLIQYTDQGLMRVLTCTYGRKSESEICSLYEQEEKSDPFGSVVNNKVKASLLVVELQVYDEVIFILELFYHLII